MNPNSTGLMRLQLTWGGGKETIFNGTISLTEGNVAFPIALGTGARIPGSFTLEEGKLLFDPQDKSAFNGFQITVFAPLSASLKVRLSGGTVASPYEKTIPLKELVQNVFSESIDSSENRFTVQRAPGDDIAVVPKHGGLVFGPDEMLHLNVFPRFLPKGENVSYFLELRLVPARSRKKNVLFEQEIPFEPNQERQLAVSVPTPGQSGVYDLVLTTNRTKKESTDRQSEIISQRTVQFVVVDSVNHWATPQRSGSFQERGTLSRMKTEFLYGFDPADPGWFKPLAHSSPAFVALLEKYGVQELQESGNWQHHTPSKAHWPGLRGISLGRTKPETPQYANGNTCPQFNGGCSSRIFAPYSNTNSPLSPQLSPEGNGQRQSLHSRWIHGLVVNHATPFGAFTKLTPSRQGATTCKDAAWGMYPIPVTHPNEPHILEIEYLSNHPQSLGISILEPTTDGEMSPLAVHSGIDIANDIFLQETAREKVLHHRVVFWPKSELPIVLLSNRHPQRSAIFGKVRLHRVVSPFPKTFSGTPNRLFAAYIHRPAFAEYFAEYFATPYDDNNNRCENPAVASRLTDWTTFYEGTNRLADYLRWSGYSGAMISVAANGGALYPSEMTPPTPEYDTGVFLAHGEDPIRKDVVELAARIFDREKMTLIPAVDFNALMPALEDRIRREYKRLAQDSSESGSSLNSVWEKRRHPELAARSGFFWIDPQGRELVQLRGTKSGCAPHYNILHPLVQEAMLNHVHEILMRYANHTSFGGVAVQLSANGFAQLPEEFWGMDDHTIAMFIDETKIQFPVFSGSQRFTRRYEYIQNECMDLWLHWRAAKVAELYRRMGQMLLQFRSDAKLYLSAGELFDGEKTQQDFYPSFSKRTGTAKTLLTLGFDWNALKNDATVVFLRPQQVAFSGQSAGQSAGQSGNIATQKERNQSDLFAASRNDVASNASAASGLLFYHRNEPWNAVSFREKSNFSGSENIRFEFQNASSSEHNRKRFIRQLAKNDHLMIFDGGLVPTFGQEESLADLIDVFRRLPDIPFRTFVPQTTDVMVSSTQGHPGNSGIVLTSNATPPTGTNRDDPPVSIQPVVVRYAHLQDETIVYLLNEAPFRVNARVTFSAARGCHFSELTHNRKIPDPVPLENRLLWTTTLKPYDLIAVRISDPKSVPVDVFVERPAEICGPRGKIPVVFDALIKATQIPVAHNGLVNPDFESDTETTIPGWERFGDETFSATLDTGRKVSGKSSLKLASSKTPGGVTSHPFDAPASGRLFVHFRLGVPAETVFNSKGNINEQKSTVLLGIALTGRHRDTGAPFLMSRDIDSVTIKNATKNAKLIDGIYWCSLDVPMTSLPLNSLERLSLRIERVHPGTVWIDEVRLNSIELTDSERFELMKLISVADYRLSNNHVSGAMELLEGFWPNLLLENAFPEGVVPQAMFPVAAVPSAARRATPASPLAQQRSYTNPQMSKPQESPSFFQKMKSWWSRP